MEFLLRVLLTLVYIFWLPFALIGRMIGGDPLQLKKPAGTSYWLMRSSPSTAASYFSEDSLNEGRPAPREGASADLLAGAKASPLMARILRRAARSFFA